VISSDVGWRMVRARGPKLREMTKIFGSMFCVQYAADTQTPIGYAATYFPLVAPHVDAMLSDNEAFFGDLRRLFPQVAKAARLLTVYNPVSSMAEPPDASNGRAHLGRPGGRPAFL